MNTSFQRKYESVEPGASVDPLGMRLLTELWAASLRQRIILLLYLPVSAFGGLYGGYALTSAYNNWITWSISPLCQHP